MIKTITVLFGNSSHISVIELKSLGKFIDDITKTEEQDVTLVYDKLKITKDELTAAVNNLEKYKVLEISEVGK